MAKHGPSTGAFMRQLLTPLNSGGGIEDHPFDIGDWLHRFRATGAEIWFADDDSLHMHSDPLNPEQHAVARELILANPNRDALRAEVEAQKELISRDYNLRLWRRHSHALSTPKPPIEDYEAWLKWTAQRALAEAARSKLEAAGVPEEMWQQDSD